MFKYSNTLSNSKPAHRGKVRQKAKNLQRVLFLGLPMVWKNYKEDTNMENKQPDHVFSLIEADKEEVRKLLRSSCMTTST